MAQGVASHPNKDLMESLWKSGLRAKGIVEHLETEGLPTVSYKALAKYGQRNWTQSLEVKIEDQSLDYVNDLVEEITSTGLGDIEKVVISKKNYPGWEKVDGESVQVEKESLAHTITIKPFEEEDIDPVEIEIVDRARVPDIRIASKAPESPSKPRKLNLGVAIPDMQIGAYSGSEGLLEPTQDERALDVAFQVMLEMENIHGIDLMVNLGDNLDFPAFSSHRTPPGYTTNQSTQYAIDRYATILATERKISPKATIVDLPSNHVIRLINTLIDKIPALVGIRRAFGETPILSVPYLCRYEEYDITMPPGGYPDGKYWASDNLLFVHGDRTSSTPGATARKYLKDGVSVIYGHHHHEEMLRNVSEQNGKVKISFAGSPGCLARVDGSIPSAKTGSDDHGKLAGVSREPWNQGIWFIWYDPKGEQDPVLEICSIEDGRTIFRGKEYTTTVDRYGTKL